MLGKQSAAAVAGQLKPHNRSLANAFFMPTYCIISGKLHEIQKSNRIVKFKLEGT